MKNKMTTDNGFILYSLIMKQKFIKKPLYVCFVDFTKAFDYVNRSALIYKLRERGVGGQFLRVIQSMYSKSKCKVKVNGELSEEIESLCGVLQGGMISPKLFNEYLYDLKSFLQLRFGIVLTDTIVQYILYADDLVLCSDTAEGLQEQIDGMYEFCKKWNMIVSLMKTKVLIFNKKDVSGTGFKIGENTIDVTKEYKYLGFIFNTHTRDPVGTIPEYLIGQARKATYQAKKLSSEVVGRLSPKLSFKVYDSQILPILEYGSDLWYKARENRKLEVFNLNYIKSTLRLRSQTTTDAVLSDSGRFPVQLRRNASVLKYWLRIANLDISDPVRSAFDTLVTMHNYGQTNWWTEVTTLLQSLDISEPETLAAAPLKIRDKIWADLKEKIYDDHMKSCMTRIMDNTNGKLRTFLKFKKEYCQETYLLHSKNLNHLTALARLRMSSHTLAIETGRHSKPKIAKENRLCKNCDLNEVEDEQHFLLRCTLYDTLRRNLLKVTALETNSLSDEDTFISLMSSHDGKIVKAMGAFVYSAFKERELRNV